MSMMILYSLHLLILIQLLECENPDHFAYPPVSNTLVRKSGLVNRLINNNTVDESEFADVQYLYHLSDENSYGPTVLPEDVTDAAIQTVREDNCERLIVHYM